MKKYYLLVTVIVLAALAVGSTGGVVRGENGATENEKEEFRDLLSTVDGVIRTVRLNNSVSENQILRLENEYRKFFSEELNDNIFRIEENLENRVASLNMGEVPSYLESCCLDENDSFSESAQVLKIVENVRWVLKDNEARYNFVLVAENDEVLVYDREISPSYMGKSDETMIKNCKELRKDIKAKASEDRGIELSFIYDHAIWIILGVSISLSLIVSLISRTVVDWEKVNRVQDKQKEIQNKLKEARNANDSKKAHKIQKKQQEFMQQHMGTMFSPMKTMIIILIPFIIVFQLLSSTYGGWVVAWMPFRMPWPDIGFLMFDRFFNGPVASLGFFGWYMLSYFGFSQVMRKIFVPNQ